jgi:hypothetical protein
LDLRIPLLSIHNDLAFVFCCWGFHLLLTLPIPFPTRNGALETCSHFGDKVVNVRHYLSLSLSVVAGCVKGGH